MGDKSYFYFTGGNKSSEIKHLRLFTYKSDEIDELEDESKLRLWKILTLITNLRIIVYTNIFTCSFPGFDICYQVSFTVMLPKITILKKIYIYIEK